MNRNVWEGRRVLITGVCGTVGRELLRQLLLLRPLEIVGVDNNESELFFLSQECQGYPYVNFQLCDIRDLASLRNRSQGIDVVLHAAALKHVILCEQAPNSAVHTNIIGVQNVITAAIDAQVERVIFTSSDKAVNPTNVMGTSKLMGERLMTAANAHKRDHGPIYASTRFGNVLGSRGSVIPLFVRQIASGGPVTLTDPKMTRFIMSLKDAASLVLDSVFLARGGEVLITKMPVARIADLAEVMIDELASVYGFSPHDIAIEVIGAKPGEKLYEELMNEEETRRTVELPQYFCVLPAFKSVYHDIVYNYPNRNGLGVDRPYNSAQESAMTKEALRTYLIERKIITKQEEQVLCV